MNEDLRKRPQDDLPYEQRMKHIIEHYRVLLEQNERLVNYAKKLETKIGELEEKLSLSKHSNEKNHNRFIEKNRETKRLQAHISWLEEKIQELEASLKATD